ncbi:Sulfur carrier protein FdhD [Streptomyces antimycoticus]
MASGDYGVSPSVRIEPETLSVLPDRLRAAQRVFDRTGGLHAAGLFTPDGELLDLREDVGRRNAVDKLVGRALQQGLLPLSGSVLMVSGRASFELAQKAVMAGIPVLAAVSAPSSLAVDLAAETGLTLVGFLRGTSMNVYAGEQRLCSADSGRRDLRSGPPAARVGGPAGEERPLRRPAPTGLVHRHRIPYLRSRSGLHSKVFLTARSG